MRTFKCNFGSGIICTIQVSATQPAQGQAHILGVEWSGTPPTKKVFRPYVAWINSVNQQLAGEWDTSIMHVFLLPDGKHEAWVYAPGKQPELIRP